MNGIPFYADSRRSIYVAPEIAPQKLRKAVRGYIPWEADPEVILLVDDTVCGGGGNGLAVTRKAVYGKPLCGSSFAIPLAEIEVAEERNYSIFFGPHCSYHFSGLSRADIRMIGDGILRLAETARREPHAPHNPFAACRADSIFLAPFIPVEKLKNALGAYAPGTPEKDVLLLLDISVFGSAKAGLLLTQNGLCARDTASDSLRIAFSNIRSCRRNERDLFLNELPCLKRIALKSDVLQTLCDAIDAHARQFHPEFSGNQGTV